jgi:hypothetical protein
MKTVTSDAPSYFHQDSPLLTTETVPEPVRRGWWLGSPSYSDNGIRQDVRRVTGRLKLAA